MEWRTILIPSAFSTGKEAASRAWEAETVDLHPIQCMEFDATDRGDPPRIFVRVGEFHGWRGEVDGGTGEMLQKTYPPRNPTLEELEECVNRFCPVGAIMGLGALVSKGPDAPLTHETGLPWLGVPLIRAGAVEGTPAAGPTILRASGGIPDAN